MNYVFNSEKKRYIVFGLFSSTLFSLLLSIYFWNKIGYVNVLRFIAFFMIFIFSAIGLCVFCLINVKKCLDDNEKLRTITINNKNNRRKKVDMMVIDKITSNLKEEPINYGNMTITELKNICKKKSIKGYSRLNKKELINLLKNLN